MRAPCVMAEASYLRTYWPSAIAPGAIAPGAIALGCPFESPHWETVSAV